MHPNAARRSWDSVFCPMSPMGPPEAGPTGVSLIAGSGCTKVEGIHSPLCSMVSGGVGLFVAQTSSVFLMSAKASTEAGKAASKGIPH